ncbi:MAG: mechanosensitive ion channel family protein [Thermoanaerobaculales bacterium]
MRRKLTGFAGRYLTGRHRKAGVLAVLAMLATLSALAAPRVEVSRRDTINPGLGAVPTEAVRSSPAAAWRSFLALARDQQFGDAAHLLDLTDVSAQQQRKTGAVLAEQLSRIVAVLQARADAVTTEDPEGPKLGGEPGNIVVAIRFERSGIAGEIDLRRTEDLGRHELAWLFSRQTVSSLPFWYRVLVNGEAAHGAEPLDVGLGPIPDTVRRGNPRETMAGFLDACQQGRFDVASFYLDLNVIPPQSQRIEGERLARRLMLVLQRTVWADPEKLSNEPLGTPETGIPENEQRFATIQTRHHRIDLLLFHRWDAELGDVWTVSRDTVARINILYDFHGYGWVGDHAPVFLFAVTFVGLQLWQWLALVVGLAVGWVASRYLGRFLLGLLRHVAARTTAHWDDRVVEALRGPLGLLLWAGMLVVVTPWLGLTPGAHTLATDLCRLLALVGLGWLLVRLADAAAAHLRATAGPTNQVGLGFLPMFTRFAKAGIVILIGLAALDVIGIKVLTIVAGLGIAGIAVAFAAQKTLENVFGTISIAGDRPFQVGDFVSIGSDSGTVEDVGFRSTRLRTVGRTVVTIPNGVVVSGRVENFAARDRIVFDPTIGLAYGATATQVAHVLEEITRLVTEHPKVFAGDRRVRLKGLGDSAIQVEVFCWIATRNWDEYTRVVEELNLAIMRIVEFAGCQFALPGRPGYASQPGAGDAERAISEAEARRGQPAKPDDGGPAGGTPPASPAPAR